MSSRSMNVLNNAGGLALDGSDKICSHSACDAASSRSPYCINSYALIRISSSLNASSGSPLQSLRSAENFVPSVPVTRTRLPQDEG